MNLLDLPREVRDQILDVAWGLEETTAPSVLYVKKWNTITDRRDPTATKVLHSSLPLASNVLHELSLVNHQLNQETKDAAVLMQTVRPDQPILELDLLLDNLTTYYATWLKITPYTGSIITTLSICIRPVHILRYTRDVIPGRMYHSPVIPVPNNQNTPAHVATWRLGALLNSLMTYGPTGMHRPDAGLKSKPFIINNLLLEIREPCFGPPKYMDANDVECADIAKCQATDLTAFLSTQLHDMFTDREGGIAPVPWGPLFLARVRKITVMAHGQNMEEVDVASYAEALNVRKFNC